MRPPVAPPAARSALATALLEFRKSPGSLSLTGREPALLFSSVRDVLQIAAGKGLEQHGIEAFEERGVQDAAAYFVRTALLAPGAHHYALLGLTRSAEAQVIKDHYRMLMRLMHPDFSANAAARVWPQDAAVRLNVAYEVLSSPERRERYDAELDAPASSAPIARPAPRAPARAEHRRTAGKPLNADSRMLLKILAGGFGAAGAVAVGAWVYLGGGEGPDSLVQRPDDVLAQAAQVVPLAMPLPSYPEPMPASVAAPAGAIIVATQPPAIAPAPLANIAAASPGLVVLAAPAVAATVPVPAPPAPAPVPVAAPLPAPPPVVATVPLQMAPPVAAPPAVVNPGVTMADVHPFLARMLQQIEAGNGDRMIGQLDAETRRSAAAQSLVKHYNGLVEGSRTVKVANVDFKAQPRDGRLLVLGNVVLVLGETQAGALRKELTVQAEFALRDGSVVMTRLSRPQE
jgi:hypothetical protein